MTIFGAQTQRTNSEMQNLLSSRFTFAWRLISETVLTGNVASITFSNIPGIYRTLVFIILSRTDRAASTDGIAWRANGDAGNNYDNYFDFFVANNTSASGGAIAANFGRIAYSTGNTAPANVFGTSVAYFNNYASSTAQKIGLGDGEMYGAAALNTIYAGRNSGIWHNTASITSLTFFPINGNNIVSGSRFSLYGIL